MPSKVESFLSRINACATAKTWVKANNVSAFEDGWKTCPEPDWLLRAVGNAGYEEGSARRVRNWVYQCLTQVQSFIKDPRSIRAMQVLDAYVRGTGTPDDLSAALTSAQAATDARVQADALAQRASAEFHATRAVASALSWSDDQWMTTAGVAPLFAARAVAQRPTTVDHDTLIQQRKQQADLFRMIFAPEVGGLIANLEHLA
jgi:hypothetical protein